MVPDTVLVMMVERFGGDATGDPVSVVGVERSVEVAHIVVKCCWIVFVVDGGEKCLDNKSGNTESLYISLPDTYWGLAACLEFQTPLIMECISRTNWVAGGT